LTLTRRQLLGLVALTLAWGINWPMMKFALRELSPLYFRALTMSAGTVMLLLWYSSRGVSMKLPRVAWGPVLLLALPNIFGWHLFSILGVKELASGRAATLGFTMPIWTVLLAAVFFGQPLTRRAMVGMACAGSAVALLVAHEFTMLAGRPLGVLWMQLAAVSWALGHLMRRCAQTATETITVDDAGVGAGLLTIAIGMEPAPNWHSAVGTLAWGRHHQLRRGPGHLVRPGAQPATAGQHLCADGRAAGGHRFGRAAGARGAGLDGLGGCRLHHGGHCQCVAADKAASPVGNGVDQQRSPRMLSHPAVRRIDLAMSGAGWRA
jgi:drug/metabolite transporter (DMT)-like permease